MFLSENLIFVLIVATTSLSVLSAVIPAFLLHFDQKKRKKNDDMQISFREPERSSEFAYNDQTDFPFVSSAHSHNRYPNLAEVLYGLVERMNELGIELNKN